MIQFAAIPFSGASVNPARSLAPDVVGNTWNSVWIYFFGPAVGAVIAWLVHTVVVRGDTNLRDDLQRIDAEVEVSAAESEME